MNKFNFVFTVLAVFFIFSFLPTFGQTSKIDRKFEEVGQTRLKMAEEQLQDILMDIKKYEGDIKHAVYRDTSEVPHVSEYLYTLKQKIDTFEDEKSNWNQRLLKYNLNVDFISYEHPKNVDMLNKVLWHKNFILLTDTPVLVNYFIGYFGREVKIDLYITYTGIFIIALISTFIEVFFLLWILSYRITQSVIVGVLVFSILWTIQYIAVSIL